MTMGKRTFDVIFAIVLICIFFVPFIILCFVLLLAEGRPIFFVSERMKTPDQAFGLIKFRSMREASENSGVTGGDKSARISKVQGMLRRIRLDELPQLWNILRGDMSFVGPRPPLRVYTDDYPELYAKVLQSRPGLTGLASLEFHAREEALLSQCSTPDETDDVYRRRCIPRKAKLDLIYQEHANMCYDLRLLKQTVWRLLPIRR